VEKTLDDDDDDNGGVY